MILVIKRETSEQVDLTYLALRPVEVVGGPGELVEVDVGADVHLARVDLHDARPRLLRRRRELDLAVEAAGPENGDLQKVKLSNVFRFFNFYNSLKRVKPEKGWVKDVDPVGGCDDLDVGGGAEPV